MEMKEYNPSVLRLVLGLLFIIPGVTKLMNPVGVIGMLQGMGFFWPIVWGWLVILSEVLFGLTVLVGWKLKYTIWPLVVIMIVASVLVVIPNMKSPTNLLFHLLAIAGLLSIAWTGPGKFAVKQ